MNDKLTQREGWLTREKLEKLRPVMRYDRGLDVGDTIIDMALYALNGSPAVDLGKVREALVEIDEANDNGGMCYSDKLHRAVQKLRSALPPAPTDHKEQG